MYRTLTESLETFYWFDEVGEWKRVFPAWERYLTIYIGSIIMYFISKRLKKRLEMHFFPLLILHKKVHQKILCTKFPFELYQKYKAM